MKIPLYIKELKKHKKAKKKFIRALKSSVIIDDSKIKIFDEYGFSNVEIKQMFDKVFFTKYKYIYIM